MKYHLTKTYFTGQRAVVQDYGDRIWAEVCDEFFTEEPFTTRKAVARLKCLRPFAERTRKLYLIAVLHNVLAEGGPIHKPTKNTWELTS
jgi:hypothetical protein